MSITPITTITVLRRKIMPLIRQMASPYNRGRASFDVPWDNLFTRDRQKVNVTVVPGCRIFYMCIMNMMNTLVSLTKCLQFFFNTIAVFIPLNSAVSDLMLLLRRGEVMPFVCLSSRLSIILRGGELANTFRDVSK